MLTTLLEPFRAYLSRKRLERLQCEAAARLLATTRESSGDDLEDADAADWRLLTGSPKEPDPADLDAIRVKARSLADTNPYARNILMLYRDFVVGTGMKHELVSGGVVSGEWSEGVADMGRASSPLTTHHSLLTRVSALWTDFLAANDWHTGNRKDWEFCLRTWRDGECFLRLFRQDTWPPRIHFIDPEHVAADPATGAPSGGIETAPDNVEIPLAYYVHGPWSIVHGRTAASAIDHGQWTMDAERVQAERILHTKIGVDANVKRGVSLFRPVLDPLKRFQGWLDVELIHRKLASSIVLVRKHQQNYPGGVTGFADSTATSKPDPQGVGFGRRAKIQPGSIIDTQGFDLQYLSPDTHFDDASLLGRTILLSIAAGTGLPEFMLSADASNANYASTLVAEGPAVRHFAAWQAFFIGQWQKLFRMVLDEAVRLGLLPKPGPLGTGFGGVTLHITPPPLAVRSRHAEAQADALYYDRGALSARELARRDGADAERMRREREDEGETRRHGDKETGIDQTRNDERRSR